MEFSYWEHQTWFSDIDFTVIGSGIVGLSCALQLKEKHPKASILVLEKGILPQGASTKNAGFACFGSVSELLSDLTQSSEEEVINLVKQRLDGLNSLRQLVGDKNLDYKPWGGYELFSNNQKNSYEECLNNLPRINKLLHSVYNESIYETKENPFGFENIKSKTIFNKYEGQLNTGKMMDELLKLAYKKDIKVINSISVSGFETIGKTVLVKTDKINFKTNQLFIATNGFSSELGIEKVKPARAQVLITKPIPNLKIQGTFHLDEGYYYFRNIDDRILFGGGRNLDFKAEETSEFGQTDLIQNKLELILNTVILPNTPYEIDHRWSGIMGVGNQKSPLISSLTDKIHYGVRLGGMGVAIGNQVGKKLADLISQS
ncbi:FAD-binding oxidoreductase [Flavobacteriales bacterium]|nr:FAD-binding oxidoreductase [Flavobacteriales bacterium]MDB4088507.1 FAD-binding oxidoreductase [Flavobacteriales bacterium]